MPIKKYVEIEWEKIRLKPFKDWGNTTFYLNVATDYPTSYVPQNISEKLITDIKQKQLEDKSWIITPKKDSDKIIFSGYVENLVKIAITVLESDEKSPVNMFSIGSEKLAEICKTSAVPIKIFPFLGLAGIIFSGLSSLIKDRDDFLGSFIYQLKRNTVFPISSPLIGEIYLNGEITGEVDVKIYIKPEDTQDTFFYHDVEIFPFSKDEIAVYYSGELSESNQLYMIWTLDNWNSNPLVKMKKVGKHWVGIIEISKDMKLCSQLELAFTNDQKDWDNKDGNNWIFNNYKWT